MWSSENNAQMLITQFYVFHLDPPSELPSDVFQCNVIRFAGAMELKLIIEAIPHKFHDFVRNLGDPTLFCIYSHDRAVGSNF